MGHKRLTVPVAQGLQRHVQPPATSPTSNGFSTSFLAQLPLELLLDILSRLDLVSTVVLGFTCRTLLLLIGHEEPEFVWKKEYDFRAKFVCTIGNNIKCLPAAQIVPETHYDGFPPDLESQAYAIMIMYGIGWSTSNYLVNRIEENRLLRKEKAHFLQSMVREHKYRNHLVCARCGVLYRNRLLHDAEGWSCYLFEDDSERRNWWRLLKRVMREARSRICPKF